MEKSVDGGYLRYYGGDKPFIVAHCTIHGDRECRLTRSTAASGARTRAAQGRPLGFLLAWLRCGCRADFVEASHHKTMRPWPSYDDRSRAREEFAAEPDAALWFAVERDRRDDEAEEPEKAP